MSAVSVGGREAEGILFQLGGAPLIIIKAPKGYLACGYIDRATAERLGDAACFVSGVKTFEDALGAKVNYATGKAKELGAKEGMGGKEALALMW